MPGTRSSRKYSRKPRLSKKTNRKTKKNPKSNKKLSSKPRLSKTTKKNPKSVKKLSRKQRAGAQQTEEDEDQNFTDAPNITGLEGYADINLKDENIRPVSASDIEKKLMNAGTKKYAIFRDLDIVIKGSFVKTPDGKELTIVKSPGGTITEGDIRYFATFLIYDGQDIHKYYILKVEEYRLTMYKLVDTNGNLKRFHKDLSGILNILTEH